MRCRLLLLLFAAIAALLLSPATAQAQPLSLREAVDRAASQNPDLAVARLRILESEAQAGAVRSRYLPQLNGTVSQTYQTANLQGIGLIFPGFPDRIGPFRVFNARPVLTQTLFDGGLIAELRQAREAFQQNRHNVEAVREATQWSVVELYLQALQAQSRIAASQARLSTARAALDQARERQQGGAASALDVVRAQQEMENEDATRIQAERDLDVLKAALKRTIGIEDSFELAALPNTPQPLPPVSPGFAAALDARPELLAEKSAVRQAELGVQRAKREYWPQASFTGDFGVLGQSPTRSLSTYSVGATVTFPIWTSGRIEKEIAAARAREKQARESLRRAQLAVREDVERARIEWQSAADALQAAQRATAAARESLELARLRFGSGLSTNLDTITAQGRLAEAEDFEIRTRYDVLRARARHARALGDVRQFFETL